MPRHYPAGNPAFGADADENIRIRLGAGETEILRGIVVGCDQPAGTPQG
jgi:hypothetical protein